MHLKEVIQRSIPPKPWEEGDNIPWNEPGFSRRMLVEHLSQEHDAASRRFQTIDRQVNWIHQAILGEKRSRILDLGCGPGFYASRLAQLGHTCTGIDYGPASIQYAKDFAKEAGLSIAYNEEDLRKADYGTGFDLAMLIYGEFNVFQPEDVRTILAKAWKALLPGGQLLLEAHTFEVIQRMGSEPAIWSAMANGLFSNQPHLLLEEGFWDEASQAATRRFFVVNSDSGDVTRYAASYQAYSSAGYRSLLEQCGFQNIFFYPSLTGLEDKTTSHLLVILARKEI
jgi:SAM-dependent methyltransferase